MGGGRGIDGEGTTTCSKGQSRHFYCGHETTTPGCAQRYTSSARLLGTLQEHISIFDHYNSLPFDHFGGSEHLATGHVGGPHLVYSIIFAYYFISSIENTFLPSSPFDFFPTGGAPGDSSSLISITSFSIKNRLKIRLL